MTRPKLRRPCITVIAIGLLMAALRTWGAQAADTPFGTLLADSASVLTPTFSSDGSTAFFAASTGRWGQSPSAPSVIYRSTRHASGWSSPVVAGFSGQHDDSDPFVAPDGYLYFTSNRPAPGKRDASTDIWRVLLDGGAAARLPEPLNSEGDEYSPVVTASRNLYFASSRSGGPGQGDIYVARWSGSRYEAPQALGPAVNSPHGEWNVWVDARETTLMFESSSRPTNVSVPGDLYLSVHTSAGWSPALPMARINSSDSDLMARLSLDERRLLFTRASRGAHAGVREVDWSPVRDSALAPLARTLVVANRSSHDLSFVPLLEGRAMATVPVGKGPHLLSNVAEGRLVASGYGQFPRPHAEPVSLRPPFEISQDPVVSWIDVAGPRETRRTALDSCAHPHATWQTHDRLYITCEDEGTVLALSLHDAREVARFATRQSGSHVLAWHEATSTLVVSNTGSGSVSLIDTASGDVAIVPLAAGSEGSTVFEDRGEVWVANAVDNSISVVDLQRRTEEARLREVCGTPLAFSQQRNQVWVACFASRELLGIDAATRQVAKRIVLREQPLNLLVHESLPLAYVAFPRMNAVAEIELQQGLETRRFAVGIEPDGLRWAEAARATWRGTLP